MEYKIYSIILDIVSGHNLICCRLMECRINLKRLGKIGKVRKWNFKKLEDINIKNILKEYYFRSNIWENMKNKKYLRRIK